MMIIKILFVCFFVTFLLIYYITNKNIQKIYSVLKYRDLSKYPLPPIIRKKVFIDKYFSNNEKKYIFKSLQHWENVTNGLIKFDVIDKSAPSLVERTQCRERIEDEPCYSFYIAKVLSTDPIVKEIDKYEEGFIWGYAYIGFIPNIILIVTDRLPNYNIFMQVITHEIGHILGLDHSSQKESIMYKYCNMNGILTEKDLKNIIVCSLFNLRKQCS